MKLEPFDPSNEQPRTNKKPRDRLLYVEDEDMNWEVAEFTLSDKYELVRAKNAREAFSLITKEQFRAVLMDIQLSGSELNGVEITKVLKGRFAGTAPSFTAGVRTEAPIIFVTAYNATYSKEELVDAGGSDMITKPVNFTNLAFAITRLLTRSALATIAKGGK